MLEAGPGINSASSESGMVVPVYSGRMYAMGLFDVTLYRWTDVYADFSTGELCLTVTAPLFDDSGTVLLGVSHSD